MQKLAKFVAFIRRQPKWRLMIAALMLGGLGLLLWRAGGTERQQISGLHRAPGTARNQRA